mmetsp:Transcript_37561/g.97150  ORF Transcript_37561/g.97150 Transcript_37561/m.97150 type:complete len:365 (-) Transcript_37561:267-1361(-)
MAAADCLDLRSRTGHPLGRLVLRGRYIDARLIVLGPAAGRRRDLGKVRRLDLPQVGDLHVIDLAALPRGCWQHGDVEGSSLSPWADDATPKPSPRVLAIEDDDLSQLALAELESPPLLLLCCCLLRRLRRLDGRLAEQCGVVTAAASALAQVHRLDVDLVPALDIGVGARQDLDVVGACFATTAQDPALQPQTGIGAVQYHHLCDLAVGELASRLAGVPVLRLVPPRSASLAPGGAAPGSDALHGGARRRSAAPRVHRLLATSLNVLSGALDRGPGLALLVRGLRGGHDAGDLVPMQDAAILAACPVHLDEAHALGAAIPDDDAVAPIDDDSVAHGKVGAVLAQVRHRRRRRVAAVLLLVRSWL